MTTGRMTLICLVGAVVMRVVFDLVRKVLGL